MQSRATNSAILLKVVPDGGGRPPKRGRGGAMVRVAVHSDLKRSGTWLGAGRGLCSRDHWKYKLRIRAAMMLLWKSGGTGHYGYRVKYRSQRRPIVEIEGPWDGRWLAGPPTLPQPRSKPRRAATSGVTTGTRGGWGQSSSSCCTSSAILTADDSRVQQRAGRLTLSAKLPARHFGANHGNWLQANLVSCPREDHRLPVSPYPICP